MYRLKVPFYMVILDIIIGIIIFLSISKALSVKDYNIFYLMIPVFIIVVLLTVIWPAMTKISLDSEGMIFSVPPYYSKKVKFEEITSVVKADIRELGEERPMFKLFGTGLWKYHAGWYLLKNRLKVLLMINKDNVIIVKTSKGVFYLSPEKMDELYDIVEKNMKRSDNNGI